MRRKPETKEQLLAKIEELRARLEEAEETLRAIRHGEVDALVVSTERGEQIFTLKSADYPYRLLVEKMGEGALTLTAEGAILYANQRFAEMLKTPLEKVIGSSIATWVAPADQDILQSLLQKGANGRVSRELTLVAGNGISLPVYLSLDLLQPEGEPAFFCSVVTDLSEQKRNETIIAAAKLAQAILDQATEGIVVCDKEGRVIRANLAACRLAGENPTGQSLAMAFPLAEGESWPSLAPLLSGETIQGLELTLARPGKTILISAGPLYGDRQELQGSVIALTDITAHKQTEAALQESEARFRRLAENAQDIIYRYEFTPKRGFTYVSPAATAITGYTPQEHYADPDLGLKLVHPEDRPRLEEYLQGKGTFGQPLVLRWLRKDGQIIWTEQQNIPLFDAQGQLVALEGIARDITQRKQAEEERNRLQIQLLQAQKMEAIGRLAGGVAHDFNNMLSIVLGYGQLLLRALPSDDLRRAYVEEIIKAAERSASLTRQLLAFSRRQILQPQVLNLNELLQDLEKMLGRLLGEDIDLELRLSPDLAPVRADPGQLEQVVINLAVNARDAMPQGGRLRIETANAELDEAYAQHHPGAVPGRYAKLAVADTGCGMDPEILAQIFEPFFTTKESGTGLGLSTVYGIVKQSGGYIWVESAPGQGAIFEIYLPQISAAPTPKKAKVEGEAEKGSGEQILVIEDEAPLRSLFERMLSSLGYRVTAATNGREALSLVEEKRWKPDLVITDVVMPEMDGAALVERLQRTYPDLKVLYTSGYTADAIGHRGVLLPDTPFLQKPFNLRTLAAKVREALRGKGS